MQTPMDSKDVWGEKVKVLSDNRPSRNGSHGQIRSTSTLHLLMDWCGTRRRNEVCGGSISSSIMSSRLPDQSLAGEGKLARTLQFFRGKAADDQ